MGDDWLPHTAAKARAISGSPERHDGKIVDTRAKR